MKNYLKTFATGEAVGQFLKVAAIGVVNTVTFFVIFNILRANTELARWIAVSIAFAIATLVSYVLNRRWTFKLREGHVVLRETVTFYIVNLVAWGATVSFVEIADAVFGPLSLVGENIALVAASGLILLPKFAGYRDVVFRKALRSRREAPTETSAAGQ